MFSQIKKVIKRFLFWWSFWKTPLGKSYAELARETSNFNAVKRFKHELLQIRFFNYLSLKQWHKIVLNAKEDDPEFLWLHKKFNRRVFSHNKLLDSIFWAKDLRFLNWIVERFEKMNFSYRQARRNYYYLRIAYGERNDNELIFKLKFIFLDQMSYKFQNAKDGELVEWYLERLDLHNCLQSYYSKFTDRISEAVSRSRRAVKRIKKYEEKKLSYS